jgi:hypothetical protein
MKWMRRIGNGWRYRLYAVQPIWLRVWIYTFFTLDWLFLLLLYICNCRHASFPRSTFVLVIEKCKFILYLKVMRHVPYLLFIHIGGFGNEEFTRFPNALHCIRCNNDMSLNVAYDFRIRNSIFVKQSYNNVTGKLRSITLATDIEFEQKKMSCRLHVNRGLISTNRYWRPANYIIDILQSKISFKADNKVWCLV